MTSVELTTVQFLDAVQDRTGGQPKVQRADCSLVGEVPVIDQGREFIAGYTSAANAYTGPLPVVLFGDHTRAFKYVDFSFALGADGVKVLAPRDGFDARFLYYYFRSIRLPSAGYSRHFKFLREFCVPKPPLTEQRRIVDLLSRAEGIVRLRREAQAKAREIISALFLDMFGDPPANLKGLKVATLGDLIAIPIRNGISPSRAGRHKGRVLTLSAITRGVFDESAVKEAMFAAPLAEGDEVSARDLLVCRGNGNKSLVGVGCFPHVDMPGVAFPDTAIAVRPKSDVLMPRFLAVQWQSQWVRQQIDAIAKTTNGTFKINQAGLSGIKLILPPLLAQRAFEERIGSVESILRQQSEALKRAEATLQSLLARTFGGKPTAAVRTEEAAVA